MTTIADHTATLRSLTERDERYRQAYPRSNHDWAMRAAHAVHLIAEITQDNRRAFAVTIAYNPPRTVRAAGPCKQISTDGTIRPIASTNRVRDSWIRPERVRKDLDELHRDVDRALFGSHFNRLSQERRTSFRGFVENVQTNIHAHIAWSVPPAQADEFPRTISKAWRRYSPGGSVQADPIEGDGQAWGWYATKCRLSDLDDPDLIVFSRSIAAK